jgi:hypothetical protein
MPIILTTAYQNNYEQNVPGFDHSFRIDPSSTFVPPPHSPPESFSKHSVSSTEAGNNQHTDPITFDGDEPPFADPSMGRSSSEENQSVPAQSKRKAQNRAAYVTNQPSPSHVLSGCVDAPIIRNANRTITLIANEHSAKEKNAMSAILKTK